MRISRSGENLVRTSNKVVDRLRWPGRRTYGGDPASDRDGISTENHMQLWRRLVEAGPRMHGAPGPRRPHKS